MLKKELSPTKKNPNLFNFLHIPAYELLLKFEKESFDKSDIFLSANSTVSKKNHPVHSSCQYSMHIFLNWGPKFLTVKNKTGLMVDL